MERPDNSVEAKKSWLFRGGIALAGATIAGLLGWRRERKRSEALVQALLASASRTALVEPVTLSNLSELPRPVARYFRQALRDKQRMIKTVRMRQTGELRSTEDEKWSGFKASEVVLPLGPGFVWTADVAMPLGTHVRVIDSYIGGVGSGRVSFLSGLPLSSQSGAAELNSGALHRYLAEAVWYPTALLPQAGVSWSPISDDAALATLTDKETTVSLEFRFNDIGEVTGIYSPGRFGRFRDGYKRLPWEGHFSYYEVRAGMRVPTFAEVGWYDSEEWQPVWKGNLIHVAYEFLP
jgi:hypothetical protein